MSRILKAQSLTDTAKPALPDGVQKIEVIKDGAGLRFTTATKRLPGWICRVANDLGWQLDDDEPGRLQGRVVSITRPPPKRNFDNLRERR